MSRQVRRSFQQQQRLAQRSFVHTDRPCRRERERLTTTTTRPRHTTLPTDLFVMRENLCSLPTCFARNSKSSLLDALSTDYTDLRIHKRQSCVVDQINRMREVHPLCALCAFVAKTKRPPRIRGGRK